MLQLAASTSNLQPVTTTSISGVLSAFHIWREKSWKAQGENASRNASSQSIFPELHRQKKKDFNEITVLLLSPLLNNFFLCATTSTRRPELPARAWSRLRGQIESHLERQRSSYAPATYANFVACPPSPLDNLESSDLRSPLRPECPSH